MFTRINLAVACCLLVSPVALAQTGVDFRDAVKATAPATVAVMLDADQFQPTVAYRLRKNENATDAQYFQLMPGSTPFTDKAKRIRAGFAVAPDLVISCDIPRDAQEVVLITHEGREVKGRIVVRDHVTGLAAIRIEDGSLSVLAVAAEAPLAGLPVLISWLQGGKTLTSQASMIATDPNSDESGLGYSQKLSAVFTPDMLGAPIVDGDGTAVGIMVNKAGTAICLPAIHVTRLADAASAETPSDLLRGMLGIQLNDQQDGNDGALIAAVTDGMPAEEAELQAGDRVMMVGERPCRSHLDVMAAVAMSRAGDEVTLEIRRGDETLERTIKLSPSKARYTRIVPTEAAQQIFQWKDGKLVPMVRDAPEGRIDLAKPQAWLFENLQVERSEFEQSLKKLEAENARLKKIVESINKTLNEERPDK